MSYLGLVNFESALIAWLRSDSTLKTLTGYDAVTKPQGIYISRGDDPLSNPPHLILDDTWFHNYIPDVDDIQQAFVHLSAYALDRVTALSIIGAVQDLAGQDSHQRDAHFADANVRTQGIIATEVERNSGQTQYGVTSSHRTQVPVTDTHVAGIRLRIIFQEVPPAP